MARSIVWGAVLLVCVWSSPALASPVKTVSCNLDRYRAGGGIKAVSQDNQLELRWAGARAQQMALRLKLVGGEPVIDQLKVGESVVAEQARIEFHLVTGMRRISRQQILPLRELGVSIDEKELDEHKWDAFWDSPLDLRAPPQGSAGRQLSSNQPPVEGIGSQPGLPRKSSEIARTQARYAVDHCAVTSNDARLSVAYSGVHAGVFSGKLVITVYQGTNLIRIEYVASTTEDSVAYKYDAGLSGLKVKRESGVMWRDTAHMPQRYSLTGKANDGRVAIHAANRLIVAETGNGAIAAFPPPHTFFWARESEKNVGNNWYRKDRDLTFGVGIRQAEDEIVERFRGNWALYSAPPGTEQHMAFYLYPAAESAAAGFDGALEFTRGDRFKALPGYKVMAHHFHTGMGERLLEAGDLDMRLRDFEPLRSAGVDIVGVADIFPEQRNPGGPKRLEVMKAYFEGAQRTSDDDFLVMPNVEATNILGGHWDVMLSKPTLWMESRAANQPLREEVPGFGTVYNLVSAADVMQMVDRENMLIFMPHPRTKGSTHYPDAIADTAAFNSDRYRGIGWRWGMGSDLSERRLSEKRVLPLFDEMNNWAAASGSKPKYLISISETFDKEPGDDVYANGPVSYLKLQTLPKLGDYSSIIAALADGDYFVTSGEVLIPSHGVNGKGRTATYNAQVEWTFPLDFVELVWGDGKRIERKVVDASNMGPFGSHRFSIAFDADSAKWVRFAAWDSAGNGAMTQPFKP